MTRDAGAAGGGRRQRPHAPCHRRTGGGAPPRWRAGAKIERVGGRRGAAVAVTPRNGVTVRVPKSVMTWVGTEVMFLGSDEVDAAAALAIVAGAYLGRPLAPGQEVGPFVEECLTRLGRSPAERVARQRLAEIGLEATEIGPAMADARRQGASDGDPALQDQSRRTVEWLLAAAALGGGPYGAVIALAAMYSGLAGK